MTNGEEAEPIRIVNALRKVRANPEYADLKPLIRRTIVYIELLERKMNYALVMIRTAEKEMHVSKNQRSIVYEENEDDDL